MITHAQYDPDTHTLTYIVYNPATLDAVVIDPVLDYDPVGSKTSTHSAEKTLAFIQEHKLHVHYILETHAHADHLSGAQFLRKKTGARVVIGAKIRIVQETFKSLLDLPETFPTDGSQFDRLVEDGERIEAGSLFVDVIETPGHTPACVTYKIDDSIYTGDALFMDDYGTGRCDFPKGSAKALYRSVHDKLYNLPGELKVYVGHDYLPDGRPLAYQTTLASARENNVQLRASTTFDEFVQTREKRDTSLKAPKLLFQSIQVNINGGRLPDPTPHGNRYLKIPVNLGKKTNDAGQPQS